MTINDEFRVPTPEEEEFYDKEYERLAPMLERYVERHRQLEDPRRQRALDAVHRLKDEIHEGAMLPVMKSWFWHGLIDILHWLIVK